MRKIVKGNNQYYIHVILSHHINKETKGKSQNIIYVKIEINLSR